MAAPCITLALPVLVYHVHTAYVKACVNNLYALVTIY